MPETFIPAKDRLFIERLDDQVSETTTPGGIIQLTPQPKYRGTVVAVGSEVTEYAPGDTIVFEEFPHQILWINGRKNYSLRVEKVFGKVVVEND